MLWEPIQLMWYQREHYRTTGMPSGTSAPMQIACSRMHPLVPADVPLISFERGEDRESLEISA